MFMKKVKLSKIIKYGKIEKKVDLKTLTSLQIGGVADYVVQPSDLEECFKLLQYVQKNKIPYMILGNGTNVLCSDDAYHGVVIKMGKLFASMQHDQEWFQVESGCALSQFIRYAIQNGYGGLEGLTGIPGSLGGAVRMNAGAFGYTISDYLQGVMYLDGDTIYYKKKEECDFGYRHSVFCDHKEWLILRIDFSLPQKAENSDQILKECMEKRLKSQELAYPSAGSVFKRNDLLPAPVSKIIDDMGLKGYRIGGAMISQKHAGFFINFASASSQNMKDLIQYVQDLVWEKYQVRLETEIEML